MVDLAMHMMDIVQNSIRAEADEIEIRFNESTEEDTLSFYVGDNGSGMNEETVSKLTDPFFTSRTTRRVGLGVPFLKMTCEQTGGWLKVNSEEGQGTEISAVYKTDNPDCLPLGDIAGYLILLFVANSNIRFTFAYHLDDNNFTIDTAELAEQGIEDLSNADMARAIKEYVRENLNELFEARSKNTFLC